jgi:nitroreductase
MSRRFLPPRPPSPDVVNLDRACRYRRLVQNRILCRDTKYYLEDGSAATENILLAARAHGLGSCWVAGDKKPYAAEIYRLVGAPPGYKLISLIPIGYPAESPEKSKRPLSDVLHWEKYSRLRR